MRLVTAEQMRELDRRAAAEGGMPSFALMENAGRALFDEAAARLGPIRGKRISVYCGTGNNGGDGFVAARLLRLAGAEVRVFVVGRPGRIAGDAGTAYRLLCQGGLEPSRAFEQPNLIVDAILGTGLSGPPREAAALAIAEVNAIQGAHIVSADIPSGLCSDTGRAAGKVIRADATVTFGYPKVGLFLEKGPDFAGEVIVSDLGFPWDSLDFEAEFMAIERAVAGAAVPSRSRQAHKGDFGHVLVAGGSEGMSGAPSLAGRGALRSGAGLVTIAAPKSCRGAVAGANPEAMSLSIGCGGSFTEEDGKEAAVAAEARSVLCLGMGIGRSDGSAAFVRSLLERTSIPAVVDADALAALVGHEDSLRSRRGPVVLTPHPGECARLLGRSATEVQADRVASVRQAASRYGAIVVLKGASTLVCDGREGGNDPKRVWVNTTGNPGMATAGSGDVLAGCIAARIGQGPDLLQAVLAGVWMHGRAGDIASREVGPVGIVSGDIADRLPRTIQELEEAT